MSWVCISCGEDHSDDGGCCFCGDSDQGWRMGDDPDYMPDCHTSGKKSYQSEEDAAWHVEQLRVSGSPDAYAYPCQFLLICPGCGREFPGSEHCHVTSSPVRRSQRRWVKQSDGTPHTGYEEGS